MTETRWPTVATRRVATRLRAVGWRIVAGETGGAAVLLVGTVAALIWVNADASSYNTVWHTTFAMRLGHGTVSQDLRGWVNTGLMTLFFLVVGLEARREFDIGDLRERKRVTLPLLAGIAGMVVPIGIYLAFNGGRDQCARLGCGDVDRYRFRARHAGARRAAFSRPAKGFHAHGRGRRRHRRAARDRDRVHQTPAYDAVAGGRRAVRVRARCSRGSSCGIAQQMYVLFGLATWLALFKSGVDPVVVGLAFGLLTYAYAAARPDLDRATEGFRQFREQPTAQLARQARAQVEAAISPNERLQQRWAPWTTYVIVPLFALANAGIPISCALHLDGGHVAHHAWASSIGYVLGKPIGIVFTSWLVTAVTQRRLRPPVGLGGGRRRRVDRRHRLHRLAADRVARVQRNAAASKRRRACWLLPCWRRSSPG